MDFLREIVGGPKNRYKENGYNLDLSYITPRLIAMAYPATGIQKLYRNPIEAVCQFLQWKHNNRYVTINLSNRTVDDKMLKNVEAFTWEDHKPPSFEVLFTICQVMAKYLEKEPQGVAVIHCNHGKGRTGTLISCFLLYSGVFDTPAQAMKYYSDKRFQKQGHGVTQPGQIAYIKYFSKLLKNPKLKPQVLYIRRVIFSGSHHLTNPYLKLVNISNGDELFSTKKNNQVLLSDIGNQLTWKFSEDILFGGDFSLEIKQESKIGKNYVGAYYFNTAFATESMEANLNELSPHSLTTSGLFDLDFKLEIHFRTSCKCEGTMKFSERCQKCRDKLTLEQQKYAKIQSVLKLRQKQLSFGRQLIAGKNPLPEQFNYIPHP